MAKLLDDTALTHVAAPSGEPGIQVQSLDYSPLAKGGKALAAGFGGVGDAMAKLSVQGNEAEDFATRAKFIDFKLQQDNAFQERQRSGSVAGWDQDYEKGAREFFKSVPEREKPKYDFALTQQSAAYSTQARDALYKQQDDYETTTLQQKSNDLLAAAQRDPTKVGTVKQDFDALLQASTLPAAKKLEIQRNANASFEEAAFKGVDWRGNPAGAKAALGLDGSAPVRSISNKIIGIESGGNANATNPNSSATGAGQFIDSTWLSMVNKYRPELAAGKSQSEILALRTDPKLSADMVSHYAAENADKLRARGIPVNEANTYLAHFLGPGGAVSLLSVDPNTPVSAVLGRDQIAANRSVLEGKTVGEVQEWAARKMGGQGQAVQFSGDPRFANIPYERRLALAADAERKVNAADAAETAATTAAYNQSLNALQTNIIDGKAGAADIETARGQGWLTDAGTISQLNGMVAKRDKANADVVNFGKAITSPDFAWNPVSTDHRDWVEAGYTALAAQPAGPLAALQAVADKTGLVPETAAVALRGALYSPNPQNVQNALQTAANLVGGKYPDIFGSVKSGGKELTDAGVAFRHYVYDRGMSAGDATKKIMEERTPEFERNVKARIKSEDMSDVVKKNLKPDDIRGAFDASWIPFNDPQLTFNPEMRTRAMGDYEEVFREKFAANGDVALSKKLALEDMKRTWGVTEVSGQKTVVKYPPERAPVYAGIQNPSEHIAQQAVSAIKDLNGVDVDRSKLRFDEVKNTGERYMRGEAPTYILSYTDKNGHVQTIPKQFYADPAAMRNEQTAKRAAASAAIQTRTAIDADMADLNRANFGVAP